MVIKKILPNDPLIVVILVKQKQIMTRCHMDTSTIAGTSLMMNLSQTQSAMSMAMVKMAAEQQNQMANMLAQNAKQAPQPVNQGGFGFSTYA
ncbi:MAG TPA: hypothetical protein PLN25_02880 [Deltaproteobacteria bacterium]|nr:hypothetical protein [Deltaproteobacteria bacterium]HQB38605.1 hypothetical protein [Deltaproteobacteria bacterium]